MMVFGLLMLWISCSIRRRFDIILSHILVNDEEIAGDICKDIM